MKTSYLALLCLLPVAACGGGGSGTAATAGTATPAATPARQGPPGVNGLLAAISGSTLQVQASDGQTAVTYTAATTFTDTVAATAAEVRVGSCVLVRGAGSGTTTHLTATSVQINAAVAGACTGGLGAPGGGRPNGPPGGTPPSGAPQAGGFGGLAMGKVTGLSGATFTVASSAPGGPGTAAPATTPVTVTSTTATVYTKTAKATAAALKTGSCVTARGTADATGSVAASEITLRPATAGSCTTGFSRG